MPDTLIRRLTILARSAQAMVGAMDFGFLFDPRRKLFAIGYRVTDGSLDPGRYDLLASEARLASFVAIAKGDVPVSHWFRLGRALTPVELDSVLVSWSGSMFEYLMPALVMRAPAGSLLEQTSRLVVGRQITYGTERGVPWGVSESGYNARDLEMTYQYSNFGVPGLGLRRGLSEDVVIAPYATGLAAMIDPTAAVRNFRRLAAAGASGAYGFYEALDYTAPRLPEAAELAVVRAYMAHHQGMLIVALANALHAGAMRARFHAEPSVQATELLLQERTPRDVAVDANGDVLVFYTDGVTEAMNEASDFFGESRLSRLVEEHAHLRADELRERILREIEAFVGRADQHDDMTMIVMKVESVGVPAREAAALHAAT
jgi:cyclic beta-1,2-glucan synthetase